MPKKGTSAAFRQITRESLLSSPWPGFTVPRYTQVPDEVFDVLMPILTEAEFKCLCYICRRTFGFRKDADAISLNQMVLGIKTRDGKIIDRGTGMSKPSVTKALSFLARAGIVEVHKRISKEGEYETNIYSLRILSAGPPKSGSRGTPPMRPSPAAGEHGQTQDKTDPQPAQVVVKNLNLPGKKSSKGVGKNINHPGKDFSRGVVANLNPQDTAPIDTVNNTASSVVAPHGYKTTATLRAYLTDLGVSASMARRLIRQYGTDSISRVLQYTLYRLSSGWQPRESVPAWLVSAITQQWKIPDWFRTADELSVEKVGRTQAQQQRLQRLEEERKREEAEMTKQRARTLRSLGISKATDLLWKKVNGWLQERDLWRPALTTTILASATEENALVLCGYPFSLEMVRQSADAIRQALAALTGSVVEVEVRLDPTLLAPTK